MIPRYISNPCWNKVKVIKPSVGDYVLATKYVDGDPGDQFCVGFFYGWNNTSGEIRYFVIDEHGNQFRRNGFRRVAKIGMERGNWIVRNISFIEKMGYKYSVWHWYRASWNELEHYR